MRSDPFLLTLLVSLLILNLWGSYRVLSSPEHGGGQKLAQLALVWLLPVLGSLLVQSMHGVAFERHFQRDLTERDGLAPPDMALGDCSSPHTQDHC